MADEPELDVDVVNEGVLLNGRSVTAMRSFEQTETGELHVVLSSGGHGVLDVASQAVAGGKLVVEVADGFEPRGRYDVIVADGVEGRFELVADSAFRVVYRENRVSLIAGPSTSDPEPSVDPTNVSPATDAVGGA